MKDEIDCRRMKADAFESLLKVYNDESKYTDVSRADCDYIPTSKSVESVFKYINYHYKIAHDK